jgi:hypothetical protein
MMMESLKKRSMKIMMKKLKMKKNLKTIHHE